MDDDNIIFENDESGDEEFDVAPQPYQPEIRYIEKYMQGLVISDSTFSEYGEIVVKNGFCCG